MRFIRLIGTPIDSHLSFGHFPRRDIFCGRRIFCRSLRMSICAAFGITVSVVRCLRPFRRIGRRFLRFRRASARKEIGCKNDQLHAERRSKADHCPDDGIQPVLNNVPLKRQFAGCSVAPGIVIGIAQEDRHAVCTLIGRLQGDTVVRIRDEACSDSRAAHTDERKIDRNADILRFTRFYGIDGERRVVIVDSRFINEGAGDRERLGTACVAQYIVCRIDTRPDRVASCGDRRFRRIPCRSVVCRATVYERDVQRISTGKAVRDAYSCRFCRTVIGQVIAERDLHSQFSRRDRQRAAAEFDGIVLVVPVSGDDIRPRIPLTAHVRDGERDTKVAVTSCGLHRVSRLIEDGHAPAVRKALISDDDHERCGIHDERCLRSVQNIIVVCFTERSRCGVSSDIAELLAVADSDSKSMRHLVEIDIVGSDHLFASVVSELRLFPDNIHRDGKQPDPHGDRFRSFIVAAGRGECGRAGHSSVRDIGHASGVLDMKIDAVKPDGQSGDDRCMRLSVVRHGVHAVFGRPAGHVKCHIGVCGPCDLECDRFGFHTFIVVRLSGNRNDEVTACTGGNRSVLLRLFIRPGPIIGSTVIIVGDASAAGDGLRAADAVSRFVFRRSVIRPAVEICCKHKCGAQDMELLFGGTAVIVGRCLDGNRQAIGTGIFRRIRTAPGRSVVGESGVEIGDRLSVLFVVAADLRLRLCLAIRPVTDRDGKGIVNALAVDQERRLLCPEAEIVDGLSDHGVHRVRACLGRDLLRQGIIFRGVGRAFVIIRYSAASRIFCQNRRLFLFSVDPVFI